MPVNHEIKSQLAKLLATENLIVEHKQVETAQFNVYTRVLILPLWEKASDIVYDMLVGHEVGHALFTPDRDWFTEEEWSGINPTFVNIVEDVRIEKLMKRKYPGLSKTFFRGYKELSDEDFFDIEGRDVNGMNLADKINLYFKIGRFIDIDFTVEEMVHVVNIEHCETFDEVLKASKKLFEYCKEQLENKKQQESQSNSEDGVSEEIEIENGRPDIGDDNTDYDDMEDGGEGEAEAEVKLSQEESTEDKSAGGGGASNQSFGDLEVETANSLENAIKNLVNDNGHENVYVEIPKANLDDIIIDNELIHQRCDENWNSYEERYKEDSSFEVFEEVDRKYSEFKKSAQKEVSYLVKEFECKKSADAYARSTTAKTGVLDTAKLHTYKYNEDLFKKVNVIPDGKNHGLIFILDWSGSMSHVMEDTIKQLYNLLWFCKKVNIPFEVYAFTLEYGAFSDIGYLQDRKNFYDIKPGNMSLESGFALLNLFTSKVNGKTLDKQMQNIFRTAYSFYNHCYYRNPIGLSLSGTPLNETLVSLHQILPEFKNKYKLQKVQCVILTDGEAHPLTYHRNVNRPWESEPYLGTAGIGCNTCLRDRKLGKVYAPFGYSYHGFTDVLLNNLRDNNPDINFIGLRVLPSRDARSFVNRYFSGYDIIEKKMKDWKKNQSVSIKTSGYHTYFGISANSLANDSEFEVQEDATKSQIKRAFVKSLKVKKLNKKVLGEFVELVA